MTDIIYDSIYYHYSEGIKNSNSPFDMQETLCIIFDFELIDEFYKRFILEHPDKFL